MISYRLGQTLINYRKKEGLTIRQFAEQSGISQIERGQANPSLSVLELLANALNVPLYTLFVNEINYENLISRKKSRKKIYRKDNNHIVNDVLTPDFMKTYIKLLTMELNPHSLSCNDAKSLILFRISKKRIKNPICIPKFR